VLFSVCAVALAPAQKTRYGQQLPKAKPGVDYPVKVHVSGIHLRRDCTTSSIEANGPCADKIYADALVDQRKLELMGYQIWFPSRPIPLIPGEYPARLFKAPRVAGANPIGDEYELVLPDQTIWRCTVTGISE
jgi:hypothetical protein